MPVSHQHQCIFVHIPKAAGTSIEYALGMHGDRHDIGVRPISGTTENPDTLFGGVLQHMTMAEIQARLPEEAVRSYFKFAFVRNPWDRLVSEYFWITEGDGRVWAGGPVGTFEEFVRSRDYGRVHRHGLDQVSFILTRDGRVGVDVVYKYEDLPEAWELICRRLRISVPLQQRMRSPHGPYRAYYTPETRAIVADVYAQDIRVFDYEF
jgi:hypothetical protein